MDGQEGNLRIRSINARGGKLALGRCGSMSMGAGNSYSPRGATATPTQKGMQSSDIPLLSMMIHIPEQAAASACYATRLVVRRDWEGLSPGCQLPRAGIHSVTGRGEG